LNETFSKFRDSSTSEVDIEGRLIFVRGASSSSLNVRSMISLAGLLFDLGAEDAIESSREDNGGVLAALSNLDSFLKVETLSSRISTRSSSASFSGVGLLLGTGFS